LLTSKRIKKTRDTNDKIIIVKSRLISKIGDIYLQSFEFIPTFEKILMKHYCYIKQLCNRLVFRVKLNKLESANCGALLIVKIMSTVFIETIIILCRVKANFLTAAQRWVIGKHFQSPDYVTEKNIYINLSTYKIRVLLYCYYITLSFTYCSIYNMYKYLYKHYCSVAPLAV